MLIDEILQKKGTYKILKILKISSKNYNSIKSEILNYFSARTLDHRLKELLEMNFIQLKERDENRIKSYYCLTKMGRIVLAVLDALEKLYSEKLDENEFLNLISHNLQINEALNFEVIWEELKVILKNKDILYTLGKNKPNKIIEFKNSGITVESEKGEDFIGINKIEKAWKHLVEDGFLNRSEHKKSSYRSSFILSFFHELDYIEIEQRKPLIIKIDKEKLIKT